MPGSTIVENKRQILCRLGEDRPSILVGTPGRLKQLVLEEIIEPLGVKQLIIVESDLFVRNYG